MKGLKLIKCKQNKWPRLPRSINYATMLTVIQIITATQIILILKGS